MMPEYMEMNIMQPKILKIEQIKSKLAFEANCYVIMKGDDAIVIDPCIPFHQVQHILKENHLNKKLQAVIVTHGHIDHFYYLDEYLDFTDKLIYHQKAVDKMGNIKKSYAILTPQKDPFVNHDKTVFVKDDDLLEFGQIKAKIIYTPGHSNCSISILIEDALFTGDTLFYHSVGRSDLYTGNPSALNESLRKLVNAYPEVTVYPGHEEITSMDEERTANPYVLEIL